MIELYQFPISHYCEKIRWALDFKGLKYKTINLIPGLHIKVTTKLADRSSVPVLKHNDTVIQYSDKILDYLEESFPKRSLMTDDEKTNQQILDLCQKMDEELGVAVRVACYHVLLDHPKVVIPFLTHKGPWYGGLFVRLGFKKLVSKMRHYMKINEQSYLESVEIISKHVEELQNRLVGNEYLFANQFTRADLTAAALLAPLALPDGYGLEWPENIPQRLLDLAKDYQPIMNWVNEIYKKHRSIPE